MNDDEEMRGYTPRDFYEDDEDPGLVHDLFERSVSSRTLGSNIQVVTYGPTSYPLVDQGGQPLFPTLSVNGVNHWLCPDLLSIHQIGAADNLRGRVVRAFFRVMEWIPW